MKRILCILLVLCLLLPLAGCGRSRRYAVHYAGFVQQVMEGQTLLIVFK